MSSKHGLSRQSKDTCMLIFSYLTIKELGSIISLVSSRFHLLVTPLLYFERADCQFHTICGAITITDSDYEQRADFELLPRSCFSKQCALRAYRNVSFDGVVAVVQRMSGISYYAAQMQRLQALFRDPLFKKQVILTRVGWGAFYFAFFIFLKSNQCVCFEIVSTSYEDECAQVYHVLRPVFDCPCYGDEFDSNTLTKVKVCVKHHVPDTTVTFNASKMTWVTSYSPSATAEPDPRLALHFLDCCSKIAHAATSANSSDAASAAELAKAQRELAVILASDEVARQALSKELLAREKPSGE